MEGVYLLQIFSEDETSEVASFLCCDKPLGQSSKDQNHQQIELKLYSFLKHEDEWNSLYQRDGKSSILLFL